MRNRRHFEAPVCHQIAMVCRDERERPHLLLTECTYDGIDPCAVTVVFRTQGMRLPWMFSRDLLILGQLGPIGDGDVRVWPTTDDRGAPLVAIRLSSPDGELVVEAPAADVRAFLNATLRVVPRGQEQEYLDLDQLVEDLLSAS